ncbi:MAG: glycosyltransferase family 2 protein [Leptospirales bacterium]|nr:glycosyltransferase family 2 protein [Leptospirales bacterium]
MDSPLLSVILPTYNESGNLRELVQRLAQALRGQRYEILVVDDNSPDRTWQLAESLAAEGAPLRVMRRLNERGLSSAVVAGMSIAAGDLLAVMDADLQHDESILPAMTQAIREQGYDLAIGSRAAQGGSYGKWSRGRRFVSWVATALARLMLPVQVKDPMSGFFVVRRSVYQQCAERINPVGFKILLEFIGRNPDLKVIEIGYQFRLRVHGETKLSGSVIRNYLLALYDLRFGKVVSPTFAMYSLVGATGVLVNYFGFLLGEAMGLGAVQVFNEQLHWAPGLGIELSILSNYILNNYLTFFERRHRGRQLWRGILVFHGISSIGAAVQWAIYEVLTNLAPLKVWLSAETARHPYYAIAILIAMISNYFLNLNFTWSRATR